MSLAAAGVRSASIAAALVVSLIVTSGCAYSSARRTAIIGGLMVVPGAVAFEVTLGHDSNPLAIISDGGNIFDPVVLASAYLLLTGVVLLAVGVTGLALFDKPLTAAEQEAAEIRAERDEAARAETQAREELAARDPSCLQQRKERLREASKLANARLRGLELQRIPLCAAPDPVRDAQVAREQAAREQAAREAQAARGAEIARDAQSAREAKASRDAQVARDQETRDPCLKLRAERLRDAGTIADAGLRAVALQSIPVCAAPAPAP